MIVKLNEHARPANGAHTSSEKGDLRELASDRVAEAVLEYGTLDSKIASLAQLRVLEGARSELALLSLGRVYVRRCIDRNGQWTSGIHLFWWTRKRLLERPAIQVNDLRVETPVPLERQVGLAQWSIVMMRLMFISDVALYARNRDPRMARLAGFAELAAASTGDLSPTRLLSWVRREGMRRLNRALSEERYLELSAQLRDAEDAADR